MKYWAVKVWCTGTLGFGVHLRDAVIGTSKMSYFIIEHMEIIDNKQVLMGQYIIFLLFLLKCC